MKDDLGNRMKFYEKNFIQDQLLPGLPIMARLDGRCFSKWTKGLQKPYDKKMSDLMIAVTMNLVDEFNAIIGYTQSDEISLIWFAEDQEHLPFGGDRTKLIGLTAAYCSVKFNQLKDTILMASSSSRYSNFNSKPAMFDSRVWQTPSNMEAINCLIWREQDATRNSISGATRAYYSHKECENKNSAEKQDMLMKKGINWNDYPTFFKRGTYVKRIKTTRKFTAGEIENLPEKHQARSNPDLMIERTDIVPLELKPLTQVENQIEVIFGSDFVVVDKEE